MSKVKLPYMIDYYRKINKLTMKQLGEKMGKSESAISKWVKGVRSPMIEDLEKLSVIFNVPIDILMFGGDEIDTNLSIESIYIKLDNARQTKVYKFAEQQLEEQESLNSKVIPMVGKTAANPSVLEYGDVDIEQQSFSHVPEGADCAIYIQGDSMEPLIKDGSIVFYKRQEDVESGEIAVVEINGDGATCKKVIKDYDNKQIILRSMNDRYEDRILQDEKVRIIGKVIL